MYRGVEHAGKSVLADHAGGFPSTDISSILPPVFVTTCPEPREPTGDIEKNKSRELNQREDNRFRGDVIDAMGESAEFEVARILQETLREKNQPATLIMGSFHLDNKLQKHINKTKQNLKDTIRADTLSKELGMTFTGIDTRGEFENVIFVKDLGTVHVEVKRTHNIDNEIKAEKQLKKGERYFQHIFNHISSHTLPVVKVAIFSAETSPSPTHTTGTTHMIHQDVLINFKVKWVEILNELQTMKLTSRFSALDYERFVSIMTGVWLMEPFSSLHPTQLYKPDKASLPSIISTID